MLAASQPYQARAIERGVVSNVALCSHKVLPTQIVKLTHPVGKKSRTLSVATKHLPETRCQVLNSAPGFDMIVNSATRLILTRNLVISES
jgi:hypothetical protein